MEKVILMNMPSTIKIYSIYSKSKIRAAVAPRPLLSLTALAASILEKGHDCKILDLQISLNPFNEISESIKSYKPNFIGLTFTTSLFPEARKISHFIKKNFPEIIILSGGVHSSIMPEEVLEQTDTDIVIFGEGDITVQEIIDRKPLNKVKGIIYKKKGKVKKNLPRELIKNLDDLPMPAYHLLDPSVYINPKIIARKNPVATIETSRGCVFNCTYCNKGVFGKNFRFKSVDRVIKEFEIIKNLGFKEIHVWDDMFSTNMQRAKKICDELIKRKLNMTWQLDCGVRVNCVDQAFFYKLKKAGCYRVAFGYESGNDQILKNVHKGATLDQAKKATSMAKKAGLEVVGFFMLGLPGETVKTMNDTINFAISLDIDFAKSTLLVPFPSTSIYNEWNKEGIIKSYDWEKYNDHSPSKVYDHPNLDWKTLGKYYNIFYKRFYLRPEFIFKRFFKSLKKGEIFHEVYYALKTFA
jgi:radical SAM superfamily enzyme YgiQ (UPF0313 family)